MQVSIGLLYVAAVVGVIKGILIMILGIDYRKRRRDKAEKLVVGGLYKNKGVVREIIRIHGCNVTYKYLNGRHRGKTMICDITKMLGWAKEILERELYDNR